MHQKTKRTYNPGFALTPMWVTIQDCPYPSIKQSDTHNPCHSVVCHLSNCFVGRVLLLQFFSHWAFLLAFMPIMKCWTISVKVLGDLEPTRKFLKLDLQPGACFQDLRQPRLAHQDTRPGVWVHSAVLREEQIYSFIPQNIIIFLAGAVTCWNPNPSQAQTTFSESLGWPDQPTVGCLWLRGCLSGEMTKQMVYRAVCFPVPQT